MKEINERWRANGTINVDEIISKRDSLEATIDAILIEDDVKDPTTHRHHRELARVYKAKLKEAVSGENFVMAEIICQTMIDAFSPKEIMFWYDNPAFNDENEGDYHHNEAGKEKIERIRTKAEELGASLGFYEEKIICKYLPVPGKNDEMFKTIIRHICETDIKEHYEKLKKDNIGKDYLDFANKVEDISQQVNRILNWRNNLLHLKDALRSIIRLNEHYNERYIGEKHHDLSKETREDSEKFLIDCGYLKTVLQRYLKYKESELKR